jgi:general stress protein CsbA
VILRRVYIGLVLSAVVALGASYALGETAGFVVSNVGTFDTLAYGFIAAQRYA